MEIQEIKTKNVRWINVSSPGKKEMAAIQKEFGFHPLDIEDCISPAQRPKLEEYPSYLFLVLLFPLYNKRTQEIVPVEIDFFIKKDAIVTVHRDLLFSFRAFFTECQKNAAQQKRALATVDTLIYEILERLFKHTFPLLDHLNLDINRIQQKMFRGNERQIIRDILLAKRNVVNFRRIMQAHKAMIRRLRDKRSKFCGGECVTIYFENLVEHTKDIWDLLTNYKDTIDAIQETNESLISFRLNDIMRLLTIISVVLLPAGLIANLFGMNTESTPILGIVGDFWILLGVMILVAIAMAGMFRKKRWM